MSRETVSANAYNAAWVLGGCCALCVIAFLFAYDVQADDASRMNSIITETVFITAAIWGTKIFALASFACVCFARGISVRDEIDRDIGDRRESLEFRLKSRNYTLDSGAFVVVLTVISFFFATAFFVWLAVAATFPVIMFASGWWYVTAKQKQMKVEEKQLAGYRT